MITLKSDRLRVELPMPGEHPNDSLRFDRAGYISEVILDGGMHFCASEPRNLVHPSSGGRGLCCEFRCDVSNEARVGEYFPKFGVGLIRKEEDDKYIFYKQYQDVKPFPVEVSQKDNMVEFITQGIPCLGYNMRVCKNIMLEDDTLTMLIQTENTGEKEIHMQEFCHNFISIDGMAAGSDYVLELPGIPDQGDGRINNRRGYSGGFRGYGRGFTFCEFTAIDTDLSVDVSTISREIPFLWKMLHKGAGAYVEGKEYFVPSQINIWGVDHILSPEIVYGFNLKPGEKLEWKRKWKFGIL